MAAIGSSETLEPEVCSCKHKSQERPYQFQRDDRLKWKSGRIVKTVAETSRTKSLVIEVPGWEGHRPGQHVDVRLIAKDGYQTQCSYSIASAPAHEHLTLVIGRSSGGKVSSYLIDELQVDDRLDLRGPIGEYFIWEAQMGGPLLLVAGGSGIAPLMAMVRHRAVLRSDVPTRLLYSSRSHDDIIYRDELDRLVRTDQSFEVIYTLTYIQPSDWTGYRRRIDKNLLSQVAWWPERKPLTFVCGPPSLVETVVTGLVALGYERARIKTSSSKGQRNADKRYR